MKTKSYARYASFNPVPVLKEQNDKLVKNAYHKSIAGLFAVIQLIENTGMVLEGEDAQKALNQYNPDFKQRCPGIYENIGKIDFIKNDKGVITIKTEQSDRVKFSYIKIQNNAKLKIVTYATGNARIDLLSGVSVGKAFIWYDLNYIKLFRRSGDLLFDYDDDHSRRKIAMADILG